MSTPDHIPDGEGFIGILESHQGIIHSVCRVYTRHSADHNDLFQDIVVQLWRAWPQFRQQCKVTTWMYRIALNVAISGMRKKKITTEMLSPTVYQIAEDTSPEFPEIERLYKALDQLSAVEKSLALLLLEDHSYDEMAMITGLTNANLRVKIHRIREKIKLLIQGV